MNKTIIIAEAGVNHNGNIELAKKLIDVAAAAGVDYVKFQTFKAEKLVTKSAKKANYQATNTGKEEEGQFDMLKKLELDKETHYLLMKYCQDKNVKFLSTAFDLDSIDLLDDLGIDLFKIPSGEITNIPYLEKIASKQKPIILSTGMSNLAEIESALSVFYKNKIEKDQITVLHCNTEYPTPMEDVNLSGMNTIADAFKVKVGYSDHTLGIEVPIAAVARGAVCIEKHFTLDKNMEGPDHLASLEPSELIEMVKTIRNIEKALGDGIKQPSKSERKNIIAARKSIHLLVSLKKGHQLTRNDLVMKRPGNGLSPLFMNKIIGSKLLKDKEADSQLQWNDILFS